MNGQALVHTGRGITEFDDVGDIADFYFGIITKDASQEDIDKIKQVLRGERSSDGRVIATQEMAREMDEFEAFLRDQQKLQTASND